MDRELFSVDPRVGPAHPSDPRIRPAEPTLQKPPAFCSKASLVQIPNLDNAPMVFIQTFKHRPIYIRMSASIHTDYNQVTCHRSSSSIGRRDASCTKESRGYRAVFLREWHPAYLESCSWVRPNITGQVGSDATQPVIFFRWLDLTRPDPRAFVNVLTLPDPTRPDSPDSD